MKPYTTTVKNLLPEMVVRATDVEEGGTAVVRVVHTYMYRDGTAIIGGDMLSVDVKHDSEITVLHDPITYRFSGYRELWALSQHSDSAPTPSS